MVVSPRTPDHNTYYGGFGGTVVAMTRRAIIKSPLNVMWYLRVSNPSEIATTNCYHFTDSQTYERCDVGGAIIFTDSPDSHHTIDQFIEIKTATLAAQITALEERIRKMQNTVRATNPIHVTIHRLTPRDT